MLSLVRTVITQATRGGRSVVSRRSFCSSPFRQGAMEVMKSARIRAENKVMDTVASCGIFLASCHYAEKRRDGKEKESAGVSSELPIADDD